MNKEQKKSSLEEMKKKIVIERLRQAPPNVQVSFGMSGGKFLSRDELIEQVKNNTDIGEKIIKIQLEYLKAFKKNMNLESG